MYSCVKKIIQWCYLWPDSGNSLLCFHYKWVTKLHNERVKLFKNDFVSRTGVDGQQERNSETSLEVFCFMITFQGIFLSFFLNFIFFYLFLLLSLSLSPSLCLGLSLPVSVSLSVLLYLYYGICFCCLCDSCVYKE